MRPHRIRARCGTRHCYAAGCRCGRCTRANTEYQREADAKRAMREPPAHGTPSAYANWLCRCDECKAAYSEYQKRKHRERRMRKLMTGSISDLPIGELP